MGILDDARALAAQLAVLPLDEKIDTLNGVRRVLHDVSPFRSEPVDLVIWARQSDVRANNYNPNAVAPPEMELLRHSVAANGYTQPIVVHQEDAYVVVDGYHRNRVGRECPEIRERVHGCLPVTQIRADRSDMNARIAATVQHNRARGEHSVERMSELVRELYEAGCKDEQIQKELGMEIDEVVRLKQITGLAALFAQRDFSEAWEANQ